MNRTTVLNRPGPRWAFLEGFQVSKDGRPYLDRLRVLQTPLFGVYLHRIHIPDRDRDPHNHPWWFASLVVSGGYEETVWDHPEDCACPWTAQTHIRHRGRWSLGTIRRSQAHRITTVHGALWTLVLTGPRRSSWGFWTEHGFTDWRDYVKAGNMAEETALWGGRS